MNRKCSLGLILLLVCLSYAEQEIDNDEPETETSVPTTELTTTEYTEPTTTKDYCHCDMEIYGLDDLDGVLKSPNFPGSHCDSGKCIYKILPHPNMTLRLDVQTASFSSGTALKFWNIILVDGEEYSIFHSLYEDHERYYSNNFADFKVWTAAKNVGIKVVYEPKLNRYGYTGFKLTFERRTDENDDHICDSSRVIITDKDTDVVVPRPFAISSGCSFLLSPATGVKARQMEEMYIDIRTTEGTYVAVRSYDDEGLFARDAFSDSNRIALADAMKVEILVRRAQQMQGSYMLPHITARLINQTCLCPGTQKTFTADVDMITIRSPGFPSLYCPGKVCHTTITSEKLDRGKSVPLILVSTNCTLSENDNLKLSSIDSSRMIFRTRKESMPTKFLRPIILNEQDLKVTFAASGQIQSRYFEMNLTRVYVPPDCVCSVFDDKDYITAGSLSTPIPAKCNILHCHWKFSAGYGYSQKYISIEFFMSKPTYGDKVYIITDTITEEYGSELLTHKRSMTSAASPIEFTFSRFNLTVENDAVLNISWKIIEACSCPEEKFYLKDNEPVVLASPNYPESYCPNLVCRHTFFAPKGHFLEIKIDYADIELYHDFLKIYDGNSTSDLLIARISGQKKNLNFNTTTDTAFMFFISDESVSNKGFHANIIAHAWRPELPEPGSTHVVLFFFITLCIFGLVGAAVYYAVKHRRDEEPQFQSLNNPIVSYHRDSDSPDNVNVSFNSGSGFIVEADNGIESI